MDQPVSETQLGWGATQKPTDFVLGVDLDGVCADFMRGLRRVAADWMEVDEDGLTLEPSVDYPEWGIQAAGGFDALYRFAVTRRDLFRIVPPVPGAALGLRRLFTAEQVRIRIITYRLYFEFFHRMAVEQTIEWLDHHDFPYWDLCFMKDKAAVGADLYIEDSASNIRDLRAAGKDVIAFITPQNRSAGLEEPQAEDWAQVEDLVMRHVETWRETREATPSLPIAGH